MSTNHTPNYNLCQWEADDKVLRSDFNADNAKIDAALGGLAERAGMKQIYSFTTEEDANRFHFELPEIDWTKWKRIIIDIKAPMGSGEHMYFCWTTAYGNRIDYFDPFGTELVLFPEGEPERHITMIYWAKTGGFLRLHQPYSFLSVISVIASNEYKSEQILAGTMFSILGEPM